jgi:8-oxo-dGTP pyrophosphatase MutT (NUDIX family)
MVKRIAWGYVARNIGNGFEVLIAERCKGEDPLRKGQLVFPGGGVRVGETYAKCAMREVLEETGIKTKEPDYFESFVNGRQFEVKNPKLTASVELNGKIHINYLDSGKSYVGRFIDLEPKQPSQEPSTQPNSDARRPRYVPFTSLSLLLRRNLTPAGQVLLSMIETPDEQSEHKMSSFKRF